MTPKREVEKQKNARPYQRGGSDDIAHRSLILVNTVVWEPTRGGPLPTGVEFYCLNWARIKICWDCDSESAGPHGPVRT